MAKPIKQNLKKKFFIRKYVLASNVTEALLLEKQTPVDGIWAEQEKTPVPQADLIGFRIPNDDGDDD